MIDVNTLTLGEVSEIERLAGTSISAFGDSNKPQGKLLTAIVYVFERRANPKYKLEEAEAMTFSELNSLFGDSDPLESEQSE